MELDWSGSAALDIVRKILSRGPQPEAQTEEARFCAQAVGLHLIMLIMTTSDANLSGRHSCALALFRAMEDALDCFAAVSLIPEAAERWAEGKLKASQAAKRWEHKIADVKLPNGEKAVDYRKRLRAFFNNFAHCAPCLTEWNLYPDFDAEEAIRAKSKLRAELKFNHEQRVLQQNAMRIGQYLLAHTLEFVDVVEMGYEQFLAQNVQLTRQLTSAKEDIKNLFLKEVGPVYLENIPPELGQPVIKHPHDPDLEMRPRLPQKEENRDVTGDKDRHQENG